jgi:hypothetical protein
MWTRREILGRGAGLAFAYAFPSLTRTSDALISKDDLAYLKKLALETIKSATKPTSQGFDFITPGGNYPALWVRDFSMAVGCGVIPAETILKHLRLIGRVQNGATERNLKSGATLPPFAIPDHINYDGKPVFYPGTYSPGEDQGSDPWGPLPPIDDHYEFIHIAYVCWTRTKDKHFLTQDGLFKKLLEALNCPLLDPKTGLVITEPPRRAVGFGFCDGVYVTGSLLFPSLLRYRALGEMIELAAAHSQRISDEWLKQRALIRKSIPITFEHDGWLLAATGVGRQPDVWGTAYALYLDVLSGSTKHRAIEALASAHRKGTIAYKGAIRHVPTDHDFSATSAWEKTAAIPLNRYQNGAYWHVPTGWVARAIAQRDHGLGKQLVGEMVAHFREEQAKGAPWECLHPQGDYRQNPVYTASVTLPLECLI